MPSDVTYAVTPRTPGTGRPGDVRLKTRAERLLSGRGGLSAAEGRSPRVR
jgi:hypothetical protein